MYNWLILTCCIVLKGDERSPSWLSTPLSWFTKMFRAWCGCRWIEMMMMICTCTSVITADIILYPYTEVNAGVVDCGKIQNINCSIVVVVRLWLGERERERDCVTCAVWLWPIFYILLATFVYPLFNCLLLLFLCLQYYYIILVLKTLYCVISVNSNTRNSVKNCFVIQVMSPNIQKRQICLES